MIRILLPLLILLYGCAETHQRHQLETLENQNSQIYEQIVYRLRVIEEKTRRYRRDPPEEELRYLLDFEKVLALHEDRSAQTDTLLSLLEENYTSLRESAQDDFKSSYKRVKEKIEATRILIHEVDESDTTSLINKEIAKSHLFAGMNLLHDMYYVKMVDYDYGAEKLRDASSISLYTSPEELVPGPVRLIINHKDDSSRTRFSTIRLMKGGEQVDCVIRNMGDVALVDFEYSVDQEYELRFDSRIEFLLGLDTVIEQSHVMKVE